MAYRRSGWAMCGLCKARRKTDDAQIGVLMAAPPSALADGNARKMAME